jgi:hypothetical protein
MRASNIARTVLVFVLVAAGASGCGGSGSVSSVELPAPTRLQIDTQGSHFEGPSPAQLDAYFFSAPTYQLSFEAGDGQRTWVAVLHLSRDQALARHASIPIAAGVLSEGQGSVQLLGGTFVEATSGSVDFSLSAGRTSGSAELAPTALSGSFDGEFSVTCWVPRSHLPPSASAAGGTDPTDGTEVLIADQGLTTPECQPFRALVPGT